MSESTSKVSPIVAIAAMSVIIFSAVGVGVMTGVIPSSISKTEEQPVKTESPETAAQAPAEKPKAAAAPRRPTGTARVAATEPVKTAPKACLNCGSVTSVDLVKQKGEGSGLGAVAGGVVGGVLGNQVGSGRGRTAATVVGAGAGAYAGHQIEKHVKSTQSYNVAVRMDDGTHRTFSYEAEPAFRAGDKVKVVDGMLVAN